MPSYSKQIHDLPDEILRRVFLLLVEDEFYKCRDSDGVGETSPTLYPWLFSKVCKSWRRICLDSGQLWSYVSLASHHDECSGSDSKSQYETAPLLATLLQLERSGNAGLFIDGTRICSCKCEIARFRAVADHADRWQSLHIDFWRTTDHSFLQSLLPTGQCLSSLQEAAFISTHVYEHQEILLPLTIQTLPNIRRVTLYDINGLDTRLGSFPWSYLTFLSLRDYTGEVEDVLGILSQCVNLNELEFYFGEGFGLDDSVPFDPQVVSLPYLTFISLENGARTAPDRLLPYIQAPTTRSLEFGNICVNSLTAFIAFITPSANSLTTLIIRYPASFNADYLRIFEVSHQLQTLRLYHPEYSPLEKTKSVSCDDLLRAAIRRGRPTEFHFLPRLESLCLYDLEFDPIILTSMVKSRIHAEADSHGLISASPSTCAPLKSLKLHFKDENSLPSHYLITVVQSVLERYADEGKLELMV